MGRKKKHAEEHENLERWLISYADFITLLFATFVVLYALSQLDLAKFRDLQISLKKAFASPSIIEGDTSIMDKSGSSIFSEGIDPNSNAIPPIFENKEAEQEKQAFEEAKKEIEDVTKSEGMDDIIDVDVSDRGLVITLVDNLFFNSGSAEIKKIAYPTLTKIGNMLKTDFPTNQIRIEGHTDNIPIKSNQYPSNWELSSARSSSVVRFMIDTFNFDKTKFAAIGYADGKPVAPNNSEGGRSKNRRVEIVVLRNKLAKSEPVVPGMAKSRMERIKELEKEQEKLVEKYKSVSDAARQLMKGTGQSVKDILFYEDPYEKESARIAKELKEKEAKKRRELRLPDLSLEKSVGLTKAEEQKIEEAKKKGHINDAVAELMKQRGETNSALIIKETNKQHQTPSANKTVVRPQSGENEIKVYHGPTQKVSPKAKQSVRPVKKDFKLPDFSLKKSTPLSKEEERKIEEAKKKGQINDAVAELMKQRGSTGDALIIKEKK